MYVRTYIHAVLNKFEFLTDDIITDNTYVACDWDNRWKEEYYDLAEAEVCV